MRLEVRRLRAGELDHELIWLAVTITSAILLTTWLKVGLPLPQCAFHNLLGIPCATCGATRAALAFSHGDFFAAWRFNPLATLSYFAIAIYDVYAVLVLVRRTPRLRLAIPRQYLVPLISGAVLLNWMYLLRHV